MIEESPNINYGRANVIVEELIRLGASRFVLSPGSRNSPLVMAAARNSRADTSIHFDERGAAFYALGYGKALHRPAVLICTSGTATANYYPALVEAYMSGTPMIILTADRPSHLRFTGENQTIDQCEIYGKYVRGFVDLEADPEAYSLRHLLQSVDELFYRATSQPKGPVHVNCQFDEPLHPAKDNSVDERLFTDINDWLKSSSPFEERPRSSEAPAELDACKEALERARRPLLIAGFREWNREDTKSIVHFCPGNVPVLTDIGSDLTFGANTTINQITNYDLILRSNTASELLKPDVVVHFGGSVVSKALNQFIRESNVDVIRITERDDLCFRPGTNGTMLRSTARGALKSLSGCYDNADQEYLKMWKQLDDRIGETIKSHHNTLDISDEAFLARCLVDSIPSGSALLLGNSMPIRDATVAGVKRIDDIAVCVNRGASGIDGNIATAVGFGDTLGRPVTALIGDLAMFHDLNSLRLVAESSVPVTVAVINNRGGGIFSFLPIAKDNPEFEEFFGTPHDLSFAKAAEMFGIGYSTPASIQEFRNAIESTFEQGSKKLIELNTDRHRNYKARMDLFDKVSRAIDDMIAEDK